MQFNSIAFMLFIPLVVAGYYLVPPAFRWFWLLSASLCFYFFTIPWFILPLVAVAAAVYTAALLIEGKILHYPAATDAAFIFGVSFPIILLLTFKYLPFFDGAAAQIAVAFNLHYPRHVIELIVPLGVSYYAFQGVSYVVDVRRGTVPAERNFGIILLYLLFFPRIVAGPIERPFMIRQFREIHKLDYGDISAGLRLMAFGFFKKMVIADRVAIPVNEIFSHHEHYHGVYFLLAAIFFSVQIYADFSGYTDIALGSARLFGIRLTENFKHPYGAASLTEFWRRWHITLTSWFRDYLYIPMGGNRVTPWRRRLNVFITFLVSGLWHGAGGTFIAWGALHGLYVIAGSLTRPARDRLAAFTGLLRKPVLHRAIGIATTTILVCFAWIFFRSENIPAALSFIRGMFFGIGDILASLFFHDIDRIRTIGDITRAGSILGFSRESYRSEMLITLLAVMALWIAGILREHGRDCEPLSGAPVWARWTLYSVMIASILYFGMFTSDQFIYFRF